MVTQSKMERLLNERRFLVSAELTPPRHHDLEKLLKHARNMADCVDVVQINDHLLSQARCANMAVGHLVKQEGLEPVLQFSLRHRNKIALQGDLHAPFIAQGLDDAMDFRLFCENEMKAAKDAVHAIFDCA